MRILLIEDDRSVSDMIGAQAAADGHLLQIAKCLEDLFRIADITGFDVIILDLEFSGLDPFLYLRKLKTLAGETEILLLSVNPRTEMKARNLGFGTKNFVAEPLSRADLFQRIDAIGQAPATQPAAHDHEPAPAPTAPASTTAAAPARAQTTTTKTADFGDRGRVLVIGSHKGGTGKSTTAMHLITGLLYEGLRVASIDLDNPQLTLTRYLENRQAFKQSQAPELPMPQHLTLPFAEDRPEEVELTVERLAKDADVLVIDTPGGTSAATRMALAWADSVITPINDSFLDLDLLAVLDPETHEFQRPGHYAKLIAEARVRRSQWNLAPIDWLVIRNRLSALDARNKRMMSEALAGLAERLDFRQGTGLSERVIYRELFLQGLTLLDLSEETTGRSTKTAHTAALQELRNLLAQLVPPPQEAPKTRPAAQFGT
jgi:chromosome partitioning protein